MSAGTAYAKRYGSGFNDSGPAGGTPADSTFLNAVEAALLQVLGVAPTADGQVAQWDFANTRFGPALLLNKNIDPAAAIDKSKLNLAGQIVNADVAGAAAISRSKLDFGSGLVNADIATAAAVSQSKIAFDAWQAYTPSLVNITLLNGSLAGKFVQIGKTVIARVEFQAGSTTTFGGGQFNIGLPVNTAAGISGNLPMGFARIVDSSAGSSGNVQVIAASASAVRFVYGGTWVVGPENGVGGTTPFTWAVGDGLYFTIVYESA